MATSTKSKDSNIIYGNQFAQRNNGQLIAGTDNRVIPHITCFKCNKKGYYIDQCLEEDNGGGENDNASNMQQIYNGDKVNEWDAIEEGVKGHIAADKVEDSD